MTIIHQLRDLDTLLLIALVLVLLISRLGSIWLQNKGEKERQAIQHEHEKRMFLDEQAHKRRMLGKNEES